MPNQRWEMPTNIPTRKLSVGFGGAVTLGPAFTTLLIYTLQQVGQDPPDAVKTAIGIIVTALVYILAGYATPPAERDIPEVKP